MKKFVFIFLCAFVFGNVAIPAFAEGPRVDLTVGVGMLRGDTTCEIGGTYEIGGTLETPSGSGELHFPISKLEFPLDVYMASVGGSIEFADKWKASIGVKKSITSNAGKVENSDWGIADFGPNSLDVCSESDADLDALIMDINLRYRLYEGFREKKTQGKMYKEVNWLCFVGLGYIHQDFDYEISNLDQRYPSLNDYYGYDVGHDSVSGRIATYEVTYTIPYIEIGTRFKIQDRICVEASLCYSPIVKVEDEDHHLLLSKIGKGDCDGDAVLVSLQGRYEFEQNWFLTLQVDYATIDVDGKYKSYVEGNYHHTIDRQIESEQIFTALMVGYTF